ncbi:MAG TPA: hypothetical protein VE983_11505 [Solirubrobacteraceae bacterium]|nr:hypothetical protein [Solirubrobacteraceae bacterium]
MAAGEAPRDPPARPAFYALAPGGWRDLVTVLHPPYTVWHLSYVALGAAAAPIFHPGRLGATAAAFLLAVGLSAHALDELHGRPLNTRLSRAHLIVLACLGLAGALALGVLGAVTVSAWLVPFIVAGCLLVPAYNLELAGGRLHRGWVFALAWGGFPALTGYFAQTLAIRPAGVLVAVACSLLSVAQRRLSTPARDLRRRTVRVVGEQELVDGTVVALDRERLASPLEGALGMLWMALALLAAGLVLVRI